MDEGVNHCLNHRHMLPDGPYLKQRCGDDLDCIAQTFTYNHQGDALRIASDDPFRFHHYWVHNICQFYDKGFELNTSPLYGWVFTTHSPAHFRFAGAVTEECSILKGDDAIEELSRTYVEMWIMRPENNFQESCNDIRYFRSKDLLTANCVETVKSSHSPATYQAIIPNISLYTDSEKNIIVNDDGVLRVRLSRKHNHEEQALRHQKLERGCVENGMTVSHIGGYELCNSRKLPEIHNCKTAEFAFDNVKDILLVRCTGSNKVYHLQGVSECVSAGYSIYLEEEYSAWRWFSPGELAWKGLSCRNNRVEASDRNGF